MSVRLLASLKVSREKFVHENYVPSDNILALVERGSFSLSTEGRSYVVGAGEAALFKKGALCQRVVIEPVVMHLFRYRSDDPIFRTPHIVFEDSVRIASTLTLLTKVERGVFKNDFEYRTRLFFDILTQYELESGTNPLEKSDPIDGAIAEISNNVSRKIHLPDISERIGLSYIQFARRFKQKTGMTPSDYVATLRLQKAKSLLSCSDVLIREIAILCGFENEYYFSNFFKKHTGISPRTFRDLAEGG